MFFSPIAFSVLMVCVVAVFSGGVITALWFQRRIHVAEVSDLTKAHSAVLESLKKAHDAEIFRLQENHDKEIVRHTKTSDEIATLLKKLRSSAQRTLSQRP